MKKLEKLTSSQVIDYLVGETAKNKGVTKTLAKQLVLNAMCYCTVMEEINQKIDFLLEEGGEDE